MNGFAILNNVQGVRQGQGEGLESSHSLSHCESGVRESDRSGE